MTTKTEPATLGGTFTFPGTSMTVHRMGYGAMQLAGKVYGVRRAMWTLPLPCCGKPLKLESITSTPATSTVRM